jgi:hypothetical protein
MGHADVVLCHERSLQETAHVNWFAFELSLDYHISARSTVAAHDDKCYHIADCCCLMLQSRHHWLLTVAAEGLMRLLQPLQYHHVYIPVMPYTLTDYLEVRCCLPMFPARVCAIQLLVIMRSIWSRTQTEPTKEPGRTPCVDAAVLTALKCMSLNNSESCSCCLLAARQRRLPLSHMRSHHEIADCL